MACLVSPLFLFKDAIADCHAMLEAHGKDLANGAHSLVESRRMQKNILAAIDALSGCIPGRDFWKTARSHPTVHLITPLVLQLFEHAENQLAAGRFYPALKSLQELETRHLPRVQKCVSGESTARLSCPPM
jgi:hypothetical protein